MPLLVMLPTVMPRVAMPEPGALMAPVEAVTPVGIPVTFTLIPELKVVVRVVLAVVVALPPGATVIDVVLSDSEKLGGGSTLMASSAVLVTPPPVAVTVTG
jgi:hypothetical protein